MAAQTLKRLHALRDTITEICSISGTPGLSYGILHGGQILQTAFTAVGVACLVEDGKFAWDSLVHDIIGEAFHFADPDLTQKVSVLDILSHRMGIQRSNQLWHGNDNVLLLDKADVIPHVQYLGSVQPYKTTVHYSNWGYALAGQLMEKESGEQWSSYIRKHLLIPLQMNNMDAKAGPNDAKPYTVLDDHSFHLLPPPTVQDGSIMDASQGIRSTVTDMLKWCQAWIKAYTSDHETLPLKQMSKVMSDITPFAKTFFPRYPYGMGTIFVMSRRTPSCRRTAHSSNTVNRAVAVYYRVLYERML